MKYFLMEQKETTLISNCVAEHRWKNSNKRAKNVTSVFGWQSIRTHDINTTSGTNALFLLEARSLLFCFDVSRSNCSDKLIRIAIKDYSCTSAAQINRIISVQTTFGGIRMVWGHNSPRILRRRHQSEDYAHVSQLVTIKNKIHRPAAYKQNYQTELDVNIWICWICGSVQTWVKRLLRDFRCRPCHSNKHDIFWNSLP